jgi:hypothetical protein
MSSVFQSLRSLFQVSASPEQDRDDQYLADSADILYAIGAYGIFMR